MSRFSSVARSLPVALFALACGGESSEERSQPGAPSFERSPIVFGSYDPPGTFFVTYEERRARYLNDNYYFYPISLSPSRTRVLQVTDDPEGNPDRVVEIFPIRENAPLLRRITVPGGLLGWSGDDTFLFWLLNTQGVLRLGVDGSRKELSFADDIVRESNVAGGSLSPDGSMAAFVVTLAGEAENAGNTLITVDMRTGAELDRWSVPSRPVFHWANDGSIVLFSARNLYRVFSGDEAVSSPVELPFEPCGASNWVEPGTVHVGEIVIHGDYGTCDSTWIVSTDGGSVVRREGPAPVAFSADGRKILLLLDSENLSVADPDGSNVERLEGIPPPHDIAW